MRRNRGHQFIIPVALGMVAVVSSTLVGNTAASASGPGDDVRVLLGRQATPGDPADVLVNYSTAEQLFEADPTRWGGAYVEGDLLVIKFVTGTADEAMKLLESKGVTRGVKLLKSQVSMADLDVAKEQVALATRGSDTVSSFGPDYSSSSLAVDVTVADSKTLKALTVASAKVPNAVPIDVVEGMPRGSTTSRYFDSIPYYGGNAIGLSSADGMSHGGCSTGFQLSGAPDGYAYAVTAGHCYAEPGQPALPDVAIVRSNGYWSGMARMWTVSVNNAGTLSGRHGDLGIYRFIPIAGRPNASLNSGIVFTGNGNTVSKRNIVGTVDLPQGYSSSFVRTSGASGYWLNNNSLGEISPDWVSLVDQTINYSNGQSINSLTIIEDASECVSRGDSGGAVYLQSGSNAAYAIGIISGTNNQGALFTNCRNYYTPVKFIYFGGSVKTG